MITFPNCKINIGLYVKAKREDGYHDIATVFHPIDLCDVLELIPRRDKKILLHQSGITVPGMDADNLCIKAWQQLHKSYDAVKGVDIYLHKAIPMGAGLGGGSADGAFMLRMMNDLYQLNMTDEELMSHALKLGSDCPFFIQNKTCFAQGRGELMELLPINLNNYKIALINPGIHISTAFAFAQVKPTSDVFDLKTLPTLPVEKWKNYVSNIFENGIATAYPVIGNIKTVLYEQGAIYASMTGTGSTVYGLFPKDQTVQLSFPPEWILKS